MTRVLSALLALVLFVAAWPAEAHHSFAATYKENETITVEGELVQFLFRNPHSFVHLMVREKDGSLARYAVEWRGANQLGEQGVTRDSLKPGDHVVITGIPGRNLKDYRIKLVTLLRPKDNFGWRAPEARE